MNGAPGFPVTLKFVLLFSGQDVAIKVIGGDGNPTSKRRQKESIDNELNVRKLGGHPNIVKVHIGCLFALKRHNKP